MHEVIVNNISFIVMGGGVIFVLVAIFLQLQVLNTTRRLGKLFKGTKKENIEELLRSQLELSEKMRRDIEKLFQDADELRGIAVKSIHKVGVARFNPFKDTGSDQSFVIALLDADDNGFVLSGLHTREGVRMYMKPITKGMSEKYKLTGEEEEAIARAKSSQTQIPKSK